MATITIKSVKDLKGNTQQVVFTRDGDVVEVLGLLEYAKLKCEFDLAMQFKSELETNLVEQKSEVDDKNEECER